ncbi:hypothetical protein DT076_07320 [Desertihabitans brevis]|uniref:DUF2384 domain-containing protein n=1 Tax=Desertihabitans brevis TaxID=2268447 RepID=A0A367YX17_9ACTN|nr:hypothetical protein [Desertihabitans brevis]RCK70443.1 hypothetical protein DT076_07320 [Desertihabitans brevis]
MTSAAEIAREMADEVVRTRRTVAALGAAIEAAHVRASPALARAVQAEEGLYQRIADEFGLLTSAEAGRRLGSRSKAARNLALSARRDGQLLALRRGRYDLFPGFQFDDHGARPVVAALIALGEEHERSEAGLVQWLMAPTTYLDGLRPVDVIDDPDRLLSVAREAFGVQW